MMTIIIVTAATPAKSPAASRRWRDRVATQSSMTAATGATKKPMLSPVTMLKLARNPVRTRTRNHASPPRARHRAFARRGCPQERKRPGKRSASSPNSLAEVSQSRGSAPASHSGASRHGAGGAGLGPGYEGAGLAPADPGSGSRLPLRTRKQPGRAFRTRKARPLSSG